MDGLIFALDLLVGIFGYRFAKNTICPPLYLIWVVMLGQLILMFVMGRNLERSNTEPYLDPPLPVEMTIAFSSGWYVYWVVQMVRDDNAKNKKKGKR
jgi:hypothetical protein